MIKNFDNQISKTPEAMNYQEFLDKASYVEIVHIKDEMDAFKNLGGEYATIVQKIEVLDESKGVHYFEGRLDKNIPDLPKDTLIAIGGGDWDTCVRERVRQLRKAGFTNVRPIKPISFACFEKLQEEHG